MSSAKPAKKPTGSKPKSKTEKNPEVEKNFCCIVCSPMNLAKDKNEQNTRNSQKEDGCSKKIKLIKLTPSAASKCCCYFCGTSENIGIISDSSESFDDKKGKSQRNCHDYIDEMMCLCECINIRGFSVADEPTMKSITFEELHKMRVFQSKNCDLAQVCFLARKHCLIQFEGSGLNLPDNKFLTIFLIKPIAVIRKILGSICPIESLVEEVEERSEYYSKTSLNGKAEVDPAKKSSQEKVHDDNCSCKEHLQEEKLEPNSNREPSIVTLSQKVVESGRVEVNEEGVRCPCPGIRVLITMENETDLCSCKKPLNGKKK